MSYSCVTKPTSQWSRRAASARYSSREGLAPVAKPGLLKRLGSWFQGLLGKKSKPSEVKTKQGRFDHYNNKRACKGRVQWHTNATRIITAEECDIYPVRHAAKVEKSAEERKPAHELGKARRQRAQEPAQEPTGPSINVAPPPLAASQVLDLLAQTAQDACAPVPAPAPEKRTDYGVGLPPVACNTY